MKPKRYICPVCGKKYFRYIDMEECAELDSKTLMKESELDTDCMGNCFSDADSGL